MSLPRTGNIKGRIVALLCGLLTVLLLLEGALRVVGHVTHHLEARSDAPALHGQYTILCLGDSFTAGHFSVRETFPRALGKLLRRRIKRNDVFVVNKGASGHNTFQIRRRLPEYVKQYRPSMVLLLAGGANRWDLYGYYRYFEKDSLLSAEKDLLYRIRIFKLAKLLYLGVTAKLDDSRHPGEAVFNAPEISIRAPAGSKTGATAGHLNTARAYFQAQDHRNARRHFELALHANPQSVESHLALARLTEGPQQFDESIGHYLAAYEIHSSTAGTGGAHVDRVRMLRRITSHSLLNNRYRAAAVRQFRNLVKRRPDLKSDLDALEKAIASAENVETWIKSDIEWVIKFCKDRGIRLVLQNYPRRETFRLDESIYLGIATKRGVPFVDHAAAFARFPNRDPYFVPRDEHPNRAGNQLMARSIYQVIAPLIPARQ